MTNKNNSEKEKISLNQLSTWGMHKQIKIEQIVDSHLQKIKDPSTDELSSITKEWCRSKQINNLENLKEWQIKNGFNEDQWKKYVTRNWKWAKWCYEEFENKIPNYYLERKAMLDKVKYSLIRLKSENLADELYLRIKEKEASFEDIAQEFSEGPERQTSGNIGPIEVGRAHPELAKLLQVSKKGQIWAPKKLEDWWVIIRMNSLENTPLDERLYSVLALELGHNFLEKKVSLAFNKSGKELNK